MAVIVNRPFMNGSWFGRVAGLPLPEWAADFDCHAWSQFSLKYILANPAVTCVLTETTDPESMEGNMGAAFGRMPDARQRQRMRELAATL
jgi:aryl-alcohol dehydrogenase-like predicted oxidoreductase